MECKFFKLYVIFLQNQELIDTLWNVNLFEISSSSLHIIELIDTLWNVNEGRPAAPLARLRN